MPQTVLGLLIALALAAPVAGCASTSDPQAGDNPGAGQIGDAPAGGQGAGGVGADPTTAPPPETPDVPSEEETPDPDPGLTVGPIIVTFNPLLLWPAPADCVSHNPATVSITYTASKTLWQIVDGNHALLAYKRAVDANAGLALAKAYKRHCFIGRSNTRPDPQRYLMDYWLDPVEDSPDIDNPDCIAHQPSELTVVNRGAIGWGVQTSSESIALFDTKADAEKAVLVMKHYNRHCYVGRGYGGADRLTYITNWFANG